MSELALTVRSHRGTYRADLQEGLFDSVAARTEARQFIIDSRVAALYPSQLGPAIDQGRALLIDATEANKSLDRLPAHVEALVARKVRRGDTLVAVGGGIVQDVTCFLAATLFRGMEWEFYPTTLLAQADSCIGSKSSINVGETKNLLGTFTPPRQVHIDPRVLGTLDAVDIRSGVGEMLKVHAIDGPSSFDRIASEYDRLFTDRSCMQRFVFRSLEIKKRFVEEDELDRGIRNVLNYGHSFGHAIEAATDFGVPHGIAVTLGMDLAGFVAAALELTSRAHFERMHPVLRKNYAGFERHPIPFERFLGALSRDKKNAGDRLGLILPGADGIPTRGQHANDERLRGACRQYLSEVRGA